MSDTYQANKQSNSLQNGNNSDEDEVFITRVVINNTLPVQRKDRNPKMSQIMTRLTEPLQQVTTHTTRKSTEKTKKENSSSANSCKRQQERSNIFRNKEPT